MTPKEMITKLDAAKNGIYPTAELEAIWVPNNMLPESYQDDREGGRTLDRVQQVYDRDVAPSLEYKRIQEAKAERVAKYAVEYSKEDTITYDVDERMQYANEQSFCDGLLKANILDADDFMG